ncbi:MAG: hypothetical protein R2939_14795 [Kofleriaceae bacterium]
MPTARTAPATAPAEIGGGRALRHHRDRGATGVGERRHQRHVHELIAGAQHQQVVGAIGRGPPRRQAGARRGAVDHVEPLGAGAARDPTRPLDEPEPADATGEGRVLGEQDRIEGRHRGAA